MPTHVIKISICVNVSLKGNIFRFPPLKQALCKCTQAVTKSSKIVVKFYLHSLHPEQYIWRKVKKYSKVFPFQEHAKYDSRAPDCNLFCVW